MQVQVVLVQMPYIFIIPQIKLGATTAFDRSQNLRGVQLHFAQCTATES